MEGFKTRCCGKKWYRKKRLDYRCSKCDADITVELMLLRDTIDNSNEKNKSD